MKRRIALLVGCLTGAALTSCGGGSTAQERPLTGEEAALMAAVQYGNMQASGARFEVAAAVTATGEQISMSGTLDWVEHSGRAVVTARGKEAAVTEVAWARGGVLERRSDLTEVLPNFGFAADSWILRPLDSRTRSLDRIIEILLRLSSTEPDNAVLIQQTEGSAWMRTDTLRGTEVDVMRYGKQTIYWLDATSGELLRFEGNNAAFNAPVVVDFTERGPQKVVLPAEGDVVPVAEIREIYGAFTTP